MPDLVPLERAHRRDPNEIVDEKMTFGQRVADRVALFGGSWTFIFDMAKRTSG